MPVIGAIGAVAGLAQTIAGGIRAHRAEKKIEGMKSPTYTPSKSIMDYYNTALQRYNVNPYQSQQYQYAQQLAGRNMAAGVNALQSRASAVGGISRLAALSNEQGLKAGVQAEQEQSRRFAQLGAAAGEKAQEERTAYQYNQLAPYERQYNLLAMKAAGGAQTANAGISNLFGGLQNMGNAAMLNKMYSDGGNSGGGSDQLNTYRRALYQPISAEKRTTLG